MTAGLHWEWRGFGEVGNAQRDRIKELKPKFATADEVTDDYLWLPGVAINVKLRKWKDGESLKLKRMNREDQTERVQLWEERPDEEFRFPIPPTGIEALGHALQASLSVGSAVNSREELLGLLRASVTNVQMITVTKVRRQYLGEPTAERVFLELADISTPERTSSIGIEEGFMLTESSSESEIDKARDAVLSLRNQLGIPSSFQVASYLEMLDRWAKRPSIE
jgi:hypothetical protein